MKKRPVIGIAPSQFDGVIKMKTEYADAVIDAGGVPVFLPYTTDESRITQYVELCDGLLFAGGVDIHPRCYGEEIESETVEVVELRDAFETALFEAYIKTRRPILGICRGIQLINVALGGSLVQHVEGHRGSEESPLVSHGICIESETVLRRIVGHDALTVNSYHHQIVKRLADPLTVSARSDDRVIEAVELKEHPFLVAVQWHPELLYKNDSAARALFSAFVAACE